MAYQTGNPGLNEKTFAGLPRAAAGERAMSLRGTVNRALLLLATLIVCASYPWSRFFATHDPATVSAPLWIGAIGGLVLSLVIIFRRPWAPVLALPYAALEGLAVGALSALFEARYPGIAIRAAALTFGVLGTLLIAYRTGLVRATPAFTKGVIAATGAIALLYVADLVAGLFGARLSFLYEGGPLAIGISLVIVVVAAMNLILNFALIESGVAMGAPRYMEWYGAFGLIVTLVWLYLEILRFLSKARR